MNEQRYPLLEDLHVLRTSALCSIRDRAFYTLTLRHRDYSDGIVSGCAIQTTRDAMSVQPGVVNFGGFSYLLQEPMTVSYAPTEEYLVLKLKFGMPEETEGCLERSVRLELSGDPELHEDEIELCRFKLKAGSILRTKYVDFFDRATEFDTVNIIHSPYASIGGGTLHPEIVAAFAREATPYRMELLDQAFCLDALRGIPISRDQIAFYLMHRLKLRPQEWDNGSLYEGLCSVLREIQGNGERETRRARKMHREVYVD